eukprot:TRINITY_DN23011_c0_g1_i1.p1 TRINITY_DN23011_c0_g1~~TRINITY_DN23011_c0_g1_i1.p1  ORF type:complete len:179 (+),score=20.58 TRINITY_DN23011_c0_g1_i1:50-586(+)
MQQRSYGDILEGYNDMTAKGGSLSTMFRNESMKGGSSLAKRMACCPEGLTPVTSNSYFKHKERSDKLEPYLEIRRVNDTTLVPPMPPISVIAGTNNVVDPTLKYTSLVCTRYPISQGATALSYHHLQQWKGFSEAVPEKELLPPGNFVPPAMRTPSGPAAVPAASPPLRAQVIRTPCG